MHCRPHGQVSAAIHVLAMAPLPPLHVYLANDELAGWENRLNHAEMLHGQLGHAKCR